MTTLDKLPVDHPDRNRPLVGCSYRWVGGGVWREILPTYAIANNVYNDLGPAWAETCVFRWEAVDTAPPTVV